MPGTVEAPGDRVSNSPAPSEKLTDSVSETRRAMVRNSPTPSEHITAQCEKLVAPCEKLTVLQLHGGSIGLHGERDVLPRRAVLVLEAEYLQ